MLKYSMVLRVLMEQSKGYGESEHTHIIILSVPCNLTPYSLVSLSCGLFPIMHIFSTVSSFFGKNKNVQSTCKQG